MELYVVERKVTFSGIVNRDHFSDAKFSSRFVANSLSRDVFGSLVFSLLLLPCTSKDRILFLEASPNSLLQVPKENLLIQRQQHRKL